MIFNIANGLAEPLFTPETLNSIFLNKNIKGHKRDLNKSKELLKKSGFSWDKAGHLIDKSEIMLSLTFIQMQETQSVKQSVLWLNRIWKI